MPDWLNTMYADALYMRTRPMNEQVDWTLGRSRPVIEPKPVSVIIDSHTIATRNSNGVWNEYDPTGRMTGRNYTSDLPNPVFTKPRDLMPLQNTCMHGTLRYMYCSDCGR